MNEKEICFILCSNNQMYMEECLYYIRHLHVPEGYQIDVLTVEEAKSMTAGYNEAMQCSKAKYKVYLHQDTFIVNPDFIRDFLNVFQQDEQIGMIGMIGSPKLPDSGIMWEGDRCGAIYSWQINDTTAFRPGNSAFSEVEAIDGLLMITQYDIPWREDLFDKWDFYDCSQSQEFIRHGYKVVVPEMKEPWCLHDSGIICLQDEYEEERQKFLKEYYGDSTNLNQNRSNYKATVILTSYNRKELLQETLKWLEDVQGISNIIIVDNGSADKTAEWLSRQQYDYVWFDEGVQGYGKLWNVILENFETEDYIIFLEADVYPEKNSIIQLINALQSEDVGIASPVSNHFSCEGSAVIDSRDALMKIHQNNFWQTGRYRKSLLVNWKMWAIRRNNMERNGYFHEKLKSPEKVLADYSLRMIKQGVSQVVCPWACIYEDFHDCREIYAEALRWQIEDESILKAEWGMNYFNLKPNRFLIDCIQEEKEKVFQVLEVGCDLGATLLEIQNCYPNCRTCGIDINEAAISVANHITDVRYGNVDELKIPFTEKYDYIIFGDVLEHLRQPEEVIKMCQELLNENGYIIASIPNIMHISVLEELINGRFTYRDTGLLDRTHIHFFTYYEIMNMFQKADYKVENISSSIFPLSDRQKEIKNVLLRLSDDTEEWMYDTFQYIVKAQKVSHMKEREE